MRACPYDFDDDDEVACCTCPPGNHYNPEPPKPWWSDILTVIYTLSVVPIILGIWATCVLLAGAGLFASVIFVAWVATSLGF